MADNIAQTLIPAPVVQLKNTQFIEDGAIVPQILEVPCAQSHIDLGRYWAIPTKDNGIFTGWWYQPAFTETGVAIEQPTYDSFLVLRVRDKLTDYTWWVLATLTQFTAACNTCCGVTMTPITYTVPVISPCTLLCDAIDDAGNYFAVFAAPTLPAGYEFIINGSYDDEPWTEQDAANLAGILTELNTNFNAAPGSPGVHITWTRSGDTFIATIQNGEGNGSSICLSIVAMVTSP